MMAVDYIHNSSDLVSIYARQQQRPKVTSKNHINVIEATTTSKAFQRHSVAQRDFKTTYYLFTLKDHH
jgi:hypothetical protein